MLHNGHRPSAIARLLHEEFGLGIGVSADHDDPNLDREAVAFFCLVIPDDAIGAPSIFDDHGGEV